MKIIYVIKVLSADEKETLLCFYVKYKHNEMMRVLTDMYVNWNSDSNVFIDSYRI